MTNIVLKLAESARSSGVKAAYGDPVDLDEGVRIIPVALVSYGFGGGSEGGETDGVAGGGGGGGASIPIGAYIRDSSGVRFEPNIVSLLAVGIPFVWVAGRALSGLVRALKKRR